MSNPSIPTSRHRSKTVKPNIPLKCKIEKHIERRTSRTTISCHDISDTYQKKVVPIVKQEILTADKYTFTGDYYWILDQYRWNQIHGDKSVSFQSYLLNHSITDSPGKI
jgi:hypothetical protein